MARCVFCIPHQDCKNRPQEEWKQQQSEGSDEEPLSVLPIHKQILSRIEPTASSDRKNRQPGRKSVPRYRLGGSSGPPVAPLRNVAPYYSLLRPVTRDYVPLLSITLYYPLLRTVKPYYALISRRLS